MALFITGLIMVLIYGVAVFGSRFLGFTLVNDALVQVSTMMGLGEDTFMRFFPIVGAILMVIGNRQMLLAKVTCDECGWQGPKRQFIKGCEQCGSHHYH